MLVMAYYFAPRIVPHSTRLARFAIGCVSLGLLGILFRWFTNRPLEWNPEQGDLVTALDLLSGLGVLIGLICGSVALFNDAGRR